MSRSRRRWLTPFVLAPTLTLAARAQDKPRPAGPTDRGFLLPNGWTITPAGDQVVADRPAAEYPPPGRRPSRPGRHQRVQRA